MQSEPRRGLILMVEDGDEQSEALDRAFRKVGLANPIRRCRDRDEALDYLHRRGAYAAPGSAPLPALLLLDLDMPGTDGRELLALVKADPDLAAIPAVVISISDNPHHIRLCYRLGAAGYVVIRAGFAGFVEAAASIKAYWSGAVTLPGHEEAPRMSDATADELPGGMLFHCRSCHATRPCPPGELHRCSADDAAWPRCCGVRMAISFPHGHPELDPTPGSWAGPCVSPDQAMRRERED